MGEHLTESVSKVVQFILENSAVLGETTFASHMPSSSSLPDKDITPLHTIVRDANANGDIVAILRYLRLLLLKNQWKRYKNWLLLSSLLVDSCDEAQLLLLEFLAICRVDCSTITDIVGILTTSPNAAISWCAQALSGTDYLEEIAQYACANATNESVFAPLVQCLDARGYKNWKAEVGLALILNSQDIYTFISCIRVFHHKGKAIIGGSSILMSRFDFFKYNTALDRAMELNGVDQDSDYMLYDLAQYICDQHERDIEPFTKGLRFLFYCLNHTRKQTKLPVALYETLSKPQILRMLFKDIEKLILLQAPNRSVPDSHLARLAMSIAAHAIQLNLFPGSVLLLFLKLLHYRKQETSTLFLDPMAHYIKVLFDEMPSLSEDVLSTLFKRILQVHMFGGNVLQGLIRTKQDQLYDVVQQSPSFRERELNPKNGYLINLSAYCSKIGVRNVEEPNGFLELLDETIAALSSSPIDTSFFVQIGTVIVPFQQVPPYEKMVLQLRYLSGKQKTDRERLAACLPFFVSLRESMVCSFMRPGRHNPFISLYIVSKLRKLFSGLMKMSEETMHFVSILEDEAIQLELSSFEQVSGERRNYAAPFLQSRAVKEAYALLNLAIIDFEIWGNQVYYAAISGAHGVTLFGGFVLVKQKYSDTDDYALLGFLITLVHESAHLLRRGTKGQYNIEKLTPTKKEGSRDPYKAGIPGNDKSSYITCSETDHGEGGFQLEEVLFGKTITAVTRQQQAYLLDSTNWQQPLNEFRRALEELGAVEMPDAVELGRSQMILTYQRDNHCDF